MDGLEFDGFHVGIDAKHGAFGYGVKNVMAFYF